MDISARKRMILTAIITLHSDSGDPVGSGILNRFLDSVSVSSATLRSEMAELTALGLLAQPYTSAGRVPTQLGLRYYVDNLMDLYMLTAQEKRFIDAAVSDMDNDPEKAAEASAKLLAEMFSLSAVAITPRSDNPHIVHFRIFRAGRFNLAVIGVSNSGSVLSRVCRVAEDISDSELALIERVLNSGMVFVSSEDANPMFVSRVMGALDISPEKSSPPLLAAAALIEDVSDARLYSNGEHNLLRYREMESQIRYYLEFVNDFGRISELLTDAAEPLSIYVGEEIDPALPGMGMIVGNYRQSGLMGHIGIAGPARMNYSYIIPRLRYYCDSLSGMLAG